MEKRKCPSGNKGFAVHFSLDPKHIRPGRRDRSGVLYLRVQGI